MGRGRYTMGAATLALALVVSSPAVASAADASPANIVVDSPSASMSKSSAARVDLPPLRRQSSSDVSASSFSGFGGFGFIPFRDLIGFVVGLLRHLFGGGGGHCQ